LFPDQLPRICWGPQRQEPRESVPKLPTAAWNKKDGPQEKGKTIKGKSQSERNKGLKNVPKRRGRQNMAPNRPRHYQPRKTGDGSIEKRCCIPGYWELRKKKGPLGTVQAKKKQGESTSPAEDKSPNGDREVEGQWDSGPPSFEMKTPTQCLKRGWKTNFNRTKKKCLWRDNQRNQKSHHQTEKPVHEKPGRKSLKSKRQTGNRERTKRKTPLSNLGVPVTIPRGKRATVKTRTEGNQQPLGECQCSMPQQPRWGG